MSMPKTAFLPPEIVVRCLKCGVKNRIPSLKLQHPARCGACGASLEEIIIPCLHCGKRNRIATKSLEGSRTSSPPRCGACGNLLLDGKDTSPST